MSLHPPNDARQDILAALRRHHRHVVGYAALTLAGAVALWAVLYGLAYWITLFLLTAALGGEAAPPPRFRLYFWAIAGGATVLAWLDQLMSPDARPRDAKPATEIMWDFVLAVPRVTLAVGGNLRAWRQLAPRELEAAVALVERVREMRRLPVQAVPIDLPEEETRDQTLFTLLLIQVLEMRREDGEAWLFPAATKPPPPEDAPALR